MKKKFFNPLVVKNNNNMKCFQCNEDKPESEYYTKTILKSGLHYKFKRCKKCFNKNRNERAKERQYEPPRRDVYQLGRFICY